jgi:hypothetical protein
MIERTKESWRRFEASKPGHRFQERYRRQQESEHGWRDPRKLFYVVGGLGQGVRGRGGAALPGLADRDALGRCEVRVVGGARLATVLGALGLVPSCYIMFLAFRENAYLAVVVKLQEERGQSVVSTGPYRYVRHPLYSSTFLFLPAAALLLGSWWGFLPGAVVLGLLVWRIPLEERVLENGLAGYDEYERNVRYRLIPRVW